MAADEVENPSARRLRLRRPARGGFSGGGSSNSTRSESLRSSDHDDAPDEVDDAIDPLDVRHHVEQCARMPAAPPGGPQDGLGARMHAVNQSGSATYAKEYRMQQLHRLLLRNMPLDRIATALGVSISTVEKDRAALKKQLRENARALHIDEMIGNQTGLYDDISGMAMQMASDGGRIDPNTGQLTGGVPTPMRLAAMRTALAANADKTRFYQNAGVYDVLRFRQSEEGGGISDIQLMMERTAQMIAQLGEDGGFPAFDPDDALDGEVIDL